MADTLSQTGCSGCGCVNCDFFLAILNLYLYLCSRIVKQKYHVEKQTDIHKKNSVCAIP